VLCIKKNYVDGQENTILYRVCLLCQDRRRNQKELAKKIFVAHVQTNRLESGKTTNIGNPLLVLLTMVFRISTDYLLCLTPIRVPKSYDIPQLGLSEKVIRRLILKTIDPDVLNRPLEHDHFRGVKLSVLRRPDGAFPFPARQILFLKIHLIYCR